MKNFLLTQSTEYDCGPVTLVNAVRFLFEREEIPPALIRAIWLYANDTYNEQGQKGTRGTSKACIRFLGHWFTEYGKSCNFPIRAEFVEGDDADIVPGSRTVRCLETGGAALSRCWSEGCGHYVLLTGITPQGIALFDPYDEPELVYDMERDGKATVCNQPCVMNRIVRMDILNSHGEEDYAMGETNIRENLLIWNTRTEKQSAEQPACCAPQKEEVTA